MMGKVNRAKLLDIGEELLVAIGEDPSRPGLVDTPLRFARWWAEFIDYDPGNTGTAFESVTVDQMVVVKDMRVWSLCEHHLLPFWCDVSVGYITSGNSILGLSKFARVAHQFSHRLQVQERLAQDIHDEIRRLTNTNHVAVYCKGEHLCMVMRGIKTSGKMISSVMGGAFKDDPSTRAEFLGMVDHE